MITIIGAGNMGSGIAQKYATEGFDVLLLDMNDAALDRGKQKIAATLEEGVQRKVFKAEQRDAIWARLNFSTDFSLAANAALVIEAVFEDKEVKKKLFAKLDGICGAQTIFATNTSSFHVSDLASATKRPDRFVGLHYFYHPAKNKLVEVIKGKLTSDETFRAAWQIQEQIGKIPIESKDTPGFVVNRFFVPWLNESMRIVSEGIANIASVEHAAKKAFDIGMGPFELMNVTGVPITLHAATTLAAELGDFYAPCPMILPIVESGSIWDLHGEVDQAKVEQVSERLLGVVFKICQQLVHVEKVCTLEDCDLGARVGLRWKRGPFEMLADQNPNQGNLAPRFVQSHIENNIGFITFNRPDAMNALNERVAKQLDEEWTRLENMPSLKGVILTARGKAFVAGADTHFFVEQINANNIDRIVRFAADAQALFRRIDQYPKPVVCCINGLALGGGLELALACDWILATPKAAFGFPETGIGIYPGLGGTQRTPRRVGVELARWLVLSGEIIDAKTAATIHLADQIVEPTQLLRTAIERVEAGQIRSEAFTSPAHTNGFGELVEAYREPLETLRESIKKIRFKAPLALSKADELIRASAKVPLLQGLESETNALGQIFATKDALLGLSSIGKAKPVFAGE